jgi:hypothetical protein
MEPVETILVPISKAAGCTIICEAELSHDCTCRQTARAVIETLDDAGLVIWPAERAVRANLALALLDPHKPDAEEMEAAQEAYNRAMSGLQVVAGATPTPSRTEEGDGW